MRSAEEAMQCCRFSTPDLIISDIKMGMMDGLTMFEQLRSSPNMKKIPFIFISATSDNASMNTAKELGATLYFPQPSTLTK